MNGKATGNFQSSKVAAVEFGPKGGYAVLLRKKQTGQCHVYRIKC